MMENLGRTEKEAEEGKSLLPSRDNHGFCFGIFLSRLFAPRTGVLLVHLFGCLAPCFAVLVIDSCHLQSCIVVIYSLT